VLSVALLGGSSTAFTVVLLLFLVGALYCLQQLFTRTLGLHRAAAVGACSVFLLNGWATGMFTSAMSAPYVLFPVVLYTTCELLRRATPLRFVAAVAAFVALFATTFAPSVVLVLLAVAAISLVIDLGRPLADRGSTASRPVRALIRVGRQAAAPVTALLVSAYVWLPIADALRHAGDDIADYSERVLPTKDAILWLTVLTPRHAFRSFDAGAYPGVTSGDWTVYLGLAPLILIAAAIPRAVGASRRLLWVAIGLITLGLVGHLGVPGLKAIALFPLFRPISTAYWAGLAAAGLVVAFGVAVDVAARRGLSTRAAAGAGAVFALAILIGAIGFDEHSTTQVVSVVLAVGMISAVIALVSFAPRHASAPSWIAFGAVALVTVELLSYQNHQRLERYDIEDHLPEYLEVIQDDLGNQRIFNAGRGGLAPEWGSALGVREITTINLVQQPWYREYFQRWVDPTGPRRKFLELGRRDGPFSSAPNALDALSVRYLIVDADLDRMDGEIAATYPLTFDDEDAGVRVYENTDAYPRAYLAASLLPHNDGAAGPLWTRDIAVTDDAQLLDEAAEAGVPATLTPADEGLTTDDDATIIDESNGRVEIELEAEHPSVLVLADTFHRNWRVKVDGTEQHIGRVNHFARGVVVPAGPATVVFTYSSPARSLGAVISLVSLVGLVVGCGAWAILRRGRHGNRPTDSGGRDDWEPPGRLDQVVRSSSGRPIPSS
jgi:hypothetical protein